jgi:hypothetical protein
MNLFAVIFPESSALFKEYFPTKLCPACRSSVGHSGPLGVLSGAPAAATIVVDGDVDAGPPGGAYLSLHRGTWQLLQKRSW